jgi:hypothetical protein
MSVNRSRKAFNGRLHRIEDIHSAGGGSEARGTLGRAFHLAHRRRRLRVPRLILVGAFLLLAFMATKVALMTALGVDAYQTRLTDLHHGDSIDRLVGYVLTIDPASRALAERLIWLIG